MALWFKHCDLTIPGEWGCIGLPANQYASSIFEGERAYREGDEILLAIPQGKRHVLAGHIFAVCTLQLRPFRTQEVINPQFAGAANQWPTAVVMDKLWSVIPRDYSEFADRALVKTASYHRGKLFRIGSPVSEELADWFNLNRGSELKIFRRSPLAQPR